MASIQELKDRIDLHDLADKLGLRRGKGDKGNYHSPHHDDKSPSLSIFKDGKSWKDWSADEGGSCIDLAMYVKGFSEIGDAVKYLHELYGWPLDRQKQEENRPKSTVEYIADRCMEQRALAIDYLAGRGITEEVARRAVEKGSVGFNDWRSPKVAEGDPGHGGPAVAFIVKTLNPGHVVAVDMRYLEPALNGGVKTQCQGEKHGYGWTSDIKRLHAAHTVYIVESPINALSVESAGLKGAAAFAVRGLNVPAIDWTFLIGKRVLICMDNDEAFPDGHQQAGRRPGPEAAWQLHEILTGMNVAAQMIDQSEWEVNDVNDYLKASSPFELQMALKKIEPWLIPGLPGGGTEAEREVASKPGRSRVYLPGHDFAKYWRYRVKEDFTSTLEIKKDPDTDKEILSYGDLAGFRVASVSRVSISGATSTMTGDPDSQPTVLFAVSVQTPRHGPKLLRRVMEDEKLHNIDQWKKFGPVWNQSSFLRMVNILERTAHLGARHAVNFVGVAWRDGNLIVNQGPDCYFTEPDKQCPYHNLTFPSGPVNDAARVIGAYQTTFRKNAALIPLIWGLGGHLKVFLGFWPHMVMQADKGAGKSVLIKRLERSIAFTMFSGQSLQTEFRLLTSISHTSHPVGWEEISARKQEIIDKAVAMLQESYQYTVNRRGSDMTEFLLSAPVLLAGEDVPVRSLLGKVVQTVLTGKKGPLMPDDLPRFPVRQWLEFLAGLKKDQVNQLYSQMRGVCNSLSRSSSDEGAKRMAGNYAALLTCWRLMCEFAGLDVSQGDFEDDVLAEMNGHIKDTSADREPWVWIVEIVLSELAAGNYRHPFKWDSVDDEGCLLIRTSHVMDHISHTNSLRDKWNMLPVKTDRVFKRQMANAGVLLTNADGHPLEVERTIRERREGHLVAISISKLERYGLYAAPQIEPEHHHH
ncbi:MAG: toprim domain-containing protein [Gammaproteobacteria bacterium]|nr:toprim domain-containing protein [Gammaproteobacteria bacterium]MBU1731000.1 toprim domain-containing protein [Gammaproteobacteria bacterium]MBU1893660.1 toprim domain-containing protein [Gammaproteobacteria bacterium]